MKVVVNLKIAAVGDNCIDWYFLQEEAYVGGCSVNVSVYVKQLGGESSYIGIVGNDENGELVKSVLKEKKVDISHVHVKPGKTAITKIELVNNDRTFRGYDEGVLVEKYLTEEDLDYICSMDFMHTSVYGKCQEILYKVKNDVTIIYDFAYMLDNEINSEVLKNIHYGFFSYEKDDEYIRNYLKNCWKQGSDILKLLVATLGEEGSLAYDGDKFYKYEVEKVKPIDTMGAGDSYISGFIIGLSRGMDLIGCMKLGSQKAIETILHKGAF